MTTETITITVRLDHLHQVWPQYGESGDETIGQKPFLDPRGRPLPPPGGHHDDEGDGGGDDHDDGVGDDHDDVGDGSGDDHDDGAGLLCSLAFGRGRRS